MAAAADVRVLTEARTALRRLIEAGERGATGVSLFGDAFRNRWGHGFIRRLEAAGIVRQRDVPPELRSSRGGRAPLVFAALDIGELESLIENEEELASVLWPVSSFVKPPVSPEPEAPETEDNGVHGTEEPQIAESSPVDEDGAAPTSALEVLQAIFTLANVIAQNVVYMREKLDRMERELQELRKAWE